MKKVLIITYYWPPAGGPGVQRVLKFVKYLPDYGWQPIVLTVRDGEFIALDESLQKEIPDGLRVYKTRALEPNLLYKKFVGMDKQAMIPDAVLTEKEIDWKKKFSHWVRLNLFLPDAKIGWLPFAVKKGKDIIRKEKPDVLFSSSPPPTVHLIAKKLAAFAKLKWVADFRDPWTNIHYYNKLPKSAMAEWLDKHLEESVLKKADRITMVNDDFFDQVDAPKTSIISNGFDSTDRPPIDSKKRNPRFTIRYMGSLKSRQYVESFFKLVGDVCSKEEFTDKIAIELIGNISPEVRQKIEQHNISCPVQLIPYQNHDAVLQKIAEADLLLLFIGRSDMAPKIISGKVFEYLMVRKPILAYGPVGGAADELLKKTGAGALFDYEDYNGAREFLLSLLKNWQENKKFSRFNHEEINKYERKALTGRLASLFEELT